MNNKLRINENPRILKESSSRHVLIIQLIEHFRSLIDESIQIRNWRRGEKYCSLLQLVQPLDEHDTFKWCKCLFYLADYSAVIRITKSISIDKLCNCKIQLQLLALKSESEFFTGQYSNSIDTSEHIVKSATCMIKKECNIRNIFFLKQIKIRALLVQARIYELNNFSKEFIEVNKNILINEDPLNVVSLEVIFCSQRLLLSEKIEIFETWKLKIPENYKWVVIIMNFRILCDHFSDLDSNSQDISKLPNISWKNSICELQELLGKIPVYTKKMNFTRNQLYSIPFYERYDLNISKSHNFDPSNYLDCEKEIIFRTISRQYETGLILTASSILDEKIPLSPLSLFLMGCYYYKQSIYSKSAHLFRRVVEIEPGFYESHLLLAHSLSLNNNHSQALLVYSHIQDQWRGSYYATLYKGVEYLKNNIYDIAEMNFKNSLLQSPNNPIIMNEYGVLEFYKKQYMRSTSIFKKALNSMLHSNITNKEILFTLKINLGFSLVYSILYCEEKIAKSILEEVIFHLQDCLKVKNINLNFYSINLILAILYQIIGEREKASEKYLECLSFENSNRGTLETLYSMCT